MTTWHNKLYDRVPDLASKDFSPSHVLHDPLIQNGHSMHVKKALTAGNQGGDINKMTVSTKEDSPSLSHAVDIPGEKKNQFQLKQIRQAIFESLSLFSSLPLPPLNSVLDAVRRWCFWPPSISGGGGGPFPSPPPHHPLPTTKQNVERRREKCVFLHQTLFFVLFGGGGTYSDVQIGRQSM